MIIKCFIHKFKMIIRGEERMKKVLREEEKYVLTREQYYQLRHLFIQVLASDKFSRAEQFKYAKGHGYTIRSLYFETIDNRDFYEKIDGIETRRKYRLRTYMNDPSFCMLEVKKKQGKYQQKISFRLSREEGEELINGNYGVLLKRGDPFLAECFAELSLNIYRPISVVTYEREAFVASENKTRITFDQYIRGSESNFDIFSEDLVETPFLDASNVVLEVKFNGFLLQYIKDLLMGLEKPQLSVSKYCLSRQASLDYFL